MSNRHARPHPPHPNGRLPATFVIVGVTFMALGVWFLPLVTCNPGAHVTTAQVLDTRVILVDADDAGEAHPAAVLYRAEARVAYTVGANPTTAGSPPRFHTTNRSGSPTSSPTASIIAPKSATTPPIPTTARPPVHVKFR